MTTENVPQPMAPERLGEIWLRSIELEYDRNPFRVCHEVIELLTEVERLKQENKHLEEERRILWKKVDELEVGYKPVLTTQEAADILNVSRPFVVQLCDDGTLPYHMVGTHRRIHWEGLIAFKEQRDAARREGLKRLTQLSEEMGGYSAEDT